MKKRKNLALCLLLGSLVLTTGLVLSSCQGNNPNENQNDNPGGNENPGENPGTDDPGKDPEPEPEEKTYKVSFAANEEVEMAVDKAEYKKGETVTITLNVKNVDKTVDLVKLSNEGEVTVVTVDKTYTFVMPESDVTVTVKLKDREYGQRALTVNQVEGFAVKFFVNDVEVTSAKKYDEVTVKVVSTSTTKRFKSLTSAAISLKEVEKGKEYTFTMIDAEVALALEVENIPSRNLTVNSGDGFAAQFKVGDEVVTSALEGTTVTLAITLQPDYFFVGVEWTGIAKESVTEVSQGAEYTFVVGLENISAVVDVDPVPTYDIKINEVDGFTTSFTVDGKEVTKVKEGQQVKLTVTYDAEFYRLNGVSGKFGEKDLIIIPVKDESSEGKKVYQFPMPAGQVDITMDAEAIPSHNLSFAGEGFTGVFKVDGKEVTSALEGQTVIAQISYDKEDYRFVEVSADGANLETFVSGEQYQFVVGQEDVVINVVLEEILEYSVKVNEVMGASVEFIVDGQVKTDKIKEGKLVNAKVTISDGYEFFDFKPEKGVEDVIDWKVGASQVNKEYNFSFVMPKHDVNFTLDVGLREKFEVIQIVDLIGGYNLEDYSLAEGDLITEGEQVKFTFTYTNYSEEEIDIKVMVNGVSYDAEFIDKVDYDEHYSVTFEMPSEDVSIYFYANKAQATEGFTLNYNEGENYKVVEVEDGGIYSNTETLSFTIVPDVGYKITSLTYSIDGAEYAEYSTYSYYGGDLDVMFSYSYTGYGTTIVNNIQESLTFNITCEYVGTYDVTLVNDYGVTLDGKTRYIYPGEQFDIKPIVEDGYIINYRPTVVNSSTGETISIYWSTYSNTGNFDMPSANVTIEFQLDVTYSVSFVENENVPSPTLDSQYYEAGDTVSGVYYAAEGYTVVDVEVVNHPEIEVSTEYNYSDSYPEYGIYRYDFRFEMPEENVQINFITKKLAEVNYDAELINVEFVGETGLVNDQLVEGETYEFVVTPVPGKTLVSEPTLTTEVDGVVTNVELTKKEENGEVSYSFVAPSTAITINVETEDMPAHIVSYSFYNIEGYDPYSSPYLTDSSGSRIRDGDEVFVGDTITVSNFYPTSYVEKMYTYDGIYLTYNGETHKVDGQSFVVPDYDFTVEIRFSKLPSNSLTFNIPEGVDITVYMADYNKSYWYSTDEISPVESGKYDFLDNMYVHVEMSLEYGYDINMIDLSTLEVLVGGEIVDVGATAEKVEDFEFTLEPLQGKDVEVNLGALAEKDSYTVSIGEDELSQNIQVFTYRFDPSAEIAYDSEKFLPGTYLYAEVSDEYSNYDLGIYSVETGELIDQISFNSTSSGGTYYNYATFKMPTENVVLRLIESV